jgi:hypothetical protein
MMRIGLARRRVDESGVIDKRLWIVVASAERGADILALE